MVQLYNYIIYFLVTYTSSGCLTKMIIGKIIKDNSQFIFYINYFPCAYP